MHVVLEGNGHAGEGSQLLSGGAGAVGGLGRGEREVGGDLQERLDLRLAGLNGIERGAGDLDGGEVAGRDARGDLARGELVEVRH